MLFATATACTSAPQIVLIGEAAASAIAFIISGDVFHGSLNDKSFT